MPKLLIILQYFQTLAYIVEPTFDRYQELYLVQDPHSDQSQIFLPRGSFDEQHEVCYARWFRPADPRYLDRQTKIDLAICSLFLNQNFTIADIICITAEDYETVVRALLKQKVIMDRCQKPRQSRSGTERRQPENDHQ